MLFFSVAMSKDGMIGKLAHNFLKIFQLQVEQNSKNLKFLTKTKRHYAVCLKMFYRLLLLSRLFQYFHHGYSSKIYILSSC